MSQTEAREIVRTIRDEIERAVDVIMTATENSLKDLAAARDAVPAPVELFENRLSQIIEACAFQDITGQRLSKLDAMLEGLSVSGSQRDSLLDGPALAGQGLDQNAADLLLQAHTP